MLHGPRPQPVVTGSFFRQMLSPALCSAPGCTHEQATTVTSKQQTVGRLRLMVPVRERTQCQPFWGRIAAVGLDLGLYQLQCP